MPGRAFWTYWQSRQDTVDQTVLKTLSQLDQNSVDTPTPNRSIYKEINLDSSFSTLMHSQSQGVLLCVHSLDTLRVVNVHLAVLHVNLDYAFGVPDDIRRFNTLVLAPEWDCIESRWPYIIMMDGFMTEDERMMISKYHPESRIIVANGIDAHNERLTDRLLPSDEELRTIFRVLRKREAMGLTIGELAAEVGVSQSRITCALTVFKELGLLRFQKDHAQYTLVPGMHVSLDDSPLRRTLLNLRHKEAIE